MIEFKFHGEKSFRDLTFSSKILTAEIVKAAICEQLRLSTDMDIELENEEGQIPLGTTWTNEEKISIVCRRIPRSRDPTVTAASLAADAAKNDVHRTQEDAAIDRLCERQGLDVIMEKDNSPKGSGPVLRYSKSYRYAVKQQERQEKREVNTAAPSASTGEDASAEEKKERPVPPDYVCNRCGHSDHWFWNCPTIDDPDHVRKVRTAKGIPRFYLTKVKDVEEAQARSLGGVTLVIPGNQTHYVWTHNPDKQEHRDRVGDTIQEKVVTAFSVGAKQVEESLKCPLCRRLFRSAVLAPCCGASFCSECAIERLCHNGTAGNQCPDCTKELMAHQLVPNQDLRNQVEAVLRASTGKKTREENLTIPTIKITSSREKRKKQEVHVAASASDAPVEPQASAACALLATVPKATSCAPGRVEAPVRAPAPAGREEGDASGASAVPDAIPAVVRDPVISAVPIPATDPSLADTASPGLESLGDMLSMPPTPADEDSPAVPALDPVADAAVDPAAPAAKDPVADIDSPDVVEVVAVVELESPGSTHGMEVDGMEVDEPLSRNEFNKLKKAWGDYHEKLARKAKRQANRASREQARQAKKRRRTGSSDDQSEELLEE